jgi:hypothetical protein
MYDIVNSILTMSLDLYKQIDQQDENTGAIKKQWIYYKTIPCHAKGIISNSSSTRTGNQQTFSNQYTNEQTLQIRTTEKLSHRVKITNIRDSYNNVVWSEINFPSDTPTVFEVTGITPITDPFGGVLGYNNNVKRSENQTIG